MKLVLMCGGVGKKMWPMSRRATPKHFLPLFNGKSLFEITYGMISSHFGPDSIFLQTNQQQAEMAMRLCSGIEKQNLLIEPETRDTGPAFGLMAARLVNINPNETFIAIQTDVLRQPTEKYLNFLETIDRLVQKEGKLVTAGMKPANPIMGVDYLRVNPRSFVFDQVKVYRLIEWLWRDTKESIVESYIRQSSVFLHANSYAWTPKSLLAAYQKHKPDWFEKLQIIINGLGGSNEAEIIATQYALMEKGPTEVVTKNMSADMYIIENPFEWIDFGTWGTFLEYADKNDLKVMDDTVYLVSSSNCKGTSTGNKFIAFVGMKDTLLVDTEDAILVCNRADTGKVGEIVEYLKNNNLDKLY